MFESVATGAGFVECSNKFELYTHCRPVAQCSLIRLLENEWFL